MASFLFTQIGNDYLNTLFQVFVSFFPWNISRDDKIASVNVQDSFIHPGIVQLSNYFRKSFSLFLITTDDTQIQQFHTVLHRWCRCNLFLIQFKWNNIFWVFSLPMTLKSFDVVSVDTMGFSPCSLDNFPFQESNITNQLIIFVYLFSGFRSLSQFAICLQANS